MKMYRPVWPLSTRAASRTQIGSDVGLSMQASQSRPSRAFRSPARSPSSSSTGPGLLLTAAVEYGDVVPAGQCVAHLVRSNKARAAQNQQPHRLRAARVRKRRQG